MSELEMKCTPIFHRAMKALESGRFNVMVFEGGSRCFYPMQEICTINGNRPICSINAGDMVKSLNPDGTTSYKRVVKVFRNKADKPMLEIRMNNGAVIKCSADHKFLYNGEYVPIIEILKKYANEKYSKL